MSDEALAVFNSVFDSANSFVYRCANDEHFTMSFMAGQIEHLCGRPRQDILNNAKVSFVEIMHDEDTKQALAAIDAAIEEGQPWDVAYRLSHPDGGSAWVRERGNAVYDDKGEMIFLEGLVVDASAEVELRKELEGTLQKTEADNAEILKLAENILRSVQKLSILAINAGIEAARAGKAGQGFAFLAREIKALADENGEWVNRITDQMAGRDSSARERIMQGSAQDQN
ncbi:methyl-accepting chemotaxis protein [Leisingera sp. S232]|uniref:methyl-accepting chemotaxis protein n=1 Tax=Leisingera sp. S232 TaxID=3415132 RepID=UPI003C79BA41